MDWTRPVEPLGEETAKKLFFISQPGTGQGARRGKLRAELGWYYTVKRWGDETKTLLL